MVLSRGRSIISLPILDRFQKDEVFHASQMQHNLDKSMVRIFGLHQNNRYYAQCFSGATGTIRCVVSFSVPSKIYGERPDEKSSRQ